MNTEFRNLEQQWYDSNGDKDKQQKILSAMRTNILNRNDGNTIYVLSQVPNTDPIDISSALLNELRKINGDMGIKESSARLESESAVARKAMLSQNKYSADNPYLACSKNDKQ